MESVREWLNDEDVPGIAHVLRGSLKGFVGSLSLLALLRRSKFSRDDMKMCLSSSAFVGLYRTFSDLLKVDSSRKPIAQFISSLTSWTEEEVEKKMLEYRPGVSGWLAGMISLGMDGFSAADSTVFLVYCVTRALWFSTSDNPLNLPAHLEGLYPIVWMCASAAVVLPHWFLFPQLVDPKYVAFLGVHGGHDTRYFMFRNHHGPLYLICHVNHMGATCTEHAIGFFPRAVGRAVKLYIPIHLLIFLVSRRRSIKQFFVGLSRSSVFLALYCTFAYLSICFTSKFIPYHQTSLPVLMSILWFAGLPVVLEDPHRQVLLAAYCVTYAVECLYRGALYKLGMQHKRSFGVAMLVMSLGVLFQHYDHWVPHMLQTSLLHCKEEPDTKEKKK